MHGKGRDEEILALAMQAVRYPGRTQIRCFVPLGKKLFVDQPMTENTAMRIDISGEIRNFLSRDRNTLICTPNFR